MFIFLKKKQNTIVEDFLSNPDKIDYTKITGEAVIDYENYDSSVNLTEEQFDILNNSAFNKEQKRQLEIGFKQGLNCIYYTNINFSANKMKVIRYWLLDDYEAELQKYPYKKLDYKMLDEIRLWYKQKLEKELSKFNYSKLDYSILAEIREWFNNGLGHKIRKYDFTNVSLSELQNERLNLINLKNKRRLEVNK